MRQVIFKGPHKFVISVVYKRGCPKTESFFIYIYKTFIGQLTTIKLKPGCA